MVPQLPSGKQNLGKFGRIRNGAGRRGKNIKDPSRVNLVNVTEAWEEENTKAMSTKDEEIDQFDMDLINPGVMANNSSLGNLVSFHGNKEEKHVDDNSDIVVRRNDTPLNMTKRGDLLRKAKVFKTFMEIMEEHPLFDLPYGDSFLYLKSVSGSSYDLDIIQHEEIDSSDYYTLSYTGITHFIGANSDFTPLDQFEREHYLFSMISEIHFFNKYWEWKMFFITLLS